MGWLLKTKQPEGPAARRDHRFEPGTKIFNGEWTRPRLFPEKVHQYGKDRRVYTLVTVIDLLKSSLPCQAPHLLEGMQTAALPPWGRGTVRTSVRLEEQPVSARREHPADIEYERLELRLVEKVHDPDVEHDSKGVVDPGEARCRRGHLLKVAAPDPVPPCMRVHVLSGDAEPQLREQGGVSSATASVVKDPCTRLDCQSRQIVFRPCVRERRI
jgi:hypothetical protein